MKLDEINIYNTYDDINNYLKKKKKFKKNKK